MPIRSVRDIEIHYELHGDRGPVVLLIHGLGSSLRDWELQVETLAQRYRVLTVDLRGHGQTTRRGPITIANFAADLRALLAALDIASAHIAGISLGACVAFQIAVDYPDIVDGLVIINSGPEGPSTDNPAHVEELAWRIQSVREQGMRGIGRMLAQRLLPAPEHEAERAVFVERWAENDPDMYLASMVAITNWTTRDRLGSLTCPCLVISGDRDYTPVAYKETYLRELPRAELVVISDSGHMTTHDQPQALNTALLRSFDQWNVTAAAS
ncbi:MAG TPA: alpha/beta hydrolase [Kofleriaceae bacterium]